MITKQKLRNTVLLYIIFSFIFLTYIPNVAAQESPQEVKTAFMDFVDGLQADGLTDSQIAPKVKERMAQLVIKLSKSGLKLNQITTIVQAAAAGAIRGASTGGGNLPIYAFALSAGAVSGASSEKLTLANQKSSLANIARSAVIGSVLEAVELGQCDKVEWAELIKTTTCCYPDTNLDKPTPVVLKNFQTGCCKKAPASDLLETISKEDCCEILGANAETADPIKKACCTIKAVWTAAFCGARVDGENPLLQDGKIIDVFQASLLEELDDFDAERESVDDVEREVQDAVEEIVPVSPSL